MQNVEVTETQAELSLALKKIAALEAEVVKHRQTQITRSARLTAARSQHQFFETLHQVTLLLNRSLNEEIILDCALDQLERFVSYDAACILLLEADQARLVRWRGYQQFEMEKFHLGASLALRQIPTLQMILETQQPVIISTVTGPTAQLYGPGRTWIQSHLSLPLCHGDKTLGFLKVDNKHSGSLDQTDAQRLHYFAEAVAAALDNAQRYERAQRQIAHQITVQKREREFVSIVLDSAEALVVVLNSEGRILRLNQVCEQATGFTTAEVRGRYLWDVFLPDGAVSETKNKFAVLQTGRQRSNSYESWWITKNGGQRLIDWSNTILPNGTGQVNYIVSTGVDITDRRQLEERLAGLHQLGRELNLLYDEAAICQIVLETASFLFDLKSSGFGVVEETQSTLDYTYHPVRGVPRQLHLKLPLNSDKRTRELTKHWQAGARQDRSDDQARPAWMTAVMMIRKRVIGVLDVEGYRSNQFTTADRQLLQTLADQTAVAIENARLHRETQNKIDELSVLGMISQAITSTLNLDDILSLITDHTTRLIDATAASVIIRDEAKDDLWFHTASGGVSDFVRGKRLPAGQGIVGWVIQHGRPALVPDVKQDVRFFGKFDQQTGFITQSILCVPLQSGRRVIGAIEAVNKRRGFFSEEDLSLLTRLATPAAIAIKNARLFEAERLAREQAEILREATSTLTSSLELDQVLNDILVHLEKVVPFDNARLFLQNKEWLDVVAEKLKPLASSPHGINRRFSADHALYHKIKDTRNPIILTNTKDHIKLAWTKTSSQTHSWMGVPLIASNEVIGWLTVDSQRESAYGPAEAALAKAFANQATVAIRNASLFRQIRSGHQQLQSLSRRLVEAQELERHRIARELHDEAGQALTSLMVGLRMLENEIDDFELVKPRVVELREITGTVSENLHRMAMDLRPASLDYLGLVPALRQYIKTCSQRHALEIEFEAINLDRKRLSDTLETSIYRIVQEAVTNVIRHARASRVDILVEHRQNHLITIVEDNGTGFYPESVVQKNRLGLLGMRERAETIGGNLVVESVPGTGTTIQLEVPHVDTHSHR